MKRLLLVLMAIMVWCVPAKAQTIGEKSTKEECLIYLNELFSGKDYNGMLLAVNLTDASIEKRLKTDSRIIEQTFQPVDWAAYSHIEVGDETDEIILVTLKFSRNTVVYENITNRKGPNENGPYNVIQSRDLTQVNEIVLYLPQENKNDVPLITKAIERLAHLEKEDEHRVSASADAIAFLESVPRPGRSLAMNMNIAIAIGEWTYSAVGEEEKEYKQYGENTFVFERLDNEGEATGEKAWIATRSLKEINLINDDIVFSGSVNYSRNDSQGDRPENLEIFRFPLGKQRPGSKPLNKEEILRHFRFEAWKYGTDLESNSLKLGDRIYN